MNPIQHILIVGGGTAGWLTAAFLARTLATAAGGVRITLVESSEIGIIGVGEGTFPSIRGTLHAIGLDEASWASLFIGHDIIPERYDPLADTVDIEKIRSQLTRMRSAIRQGADSMPPHGMFLEKYCAAGKEAHA